MKPTKHIGNLENAALLPVNVISTMAGHDGEAALRDAGVVFYAPLADHPHLRLVQLPQGWRVVPLETVRVPGHRLNLLDEKNRVRARLWQYYHYPESASNWQVGAQMKVVCPFIISFRGENANKLVVCLHRRYGGEVKAMPPSPIKAIKNRGEFGKFKVEKVESMKQWMDETIPDWKNTAKYWDHQQIA